jgi:hypothetical protein
MEGMIPQPGEAATMSELRSISLLGVTLARVAQEKDLKVVSSL